MSDPKSYALYDEPASVQDYLTHKKITPPWDYRRALGMSLL